MKRRELDVISAPLRGANLIEANAGTGKTYNITALYARMLVELKYNVESILVVTYTNAAVSDLKGKIYSRLCSLRDAMTALKNGTKLGNDDPFSTEYAQKRASSTETDLKSVKGAIRDFDQCSIFTIHGFCQRMLKENAFSGRIPYDVELTGDSRELIKRPIYDFWRNTVYKADKAIIPYLTNDTPDSLIDFYMDIQGNLAIEVEKPEKMVEDAELLNCIDELTNCFEKVKDSFTVNSEELFSLMDNTRKDFPLNKMTYKSNLTKDSFVELMRLISAGDIHPPLENVNKKIHRFTQSAINEKAKTGTIEHPFFVLVEDWYNKEAEFQETAKLYTASIRYKLYEYLQNVLEKHKLKNNLQSYDDLIARMRSAVLDNEGQGGMTSSLNKKYSAALIDEFQDTDPYQYDIFNTAFGKQGKPFFMIGDPKQAIYSFRGADVFAYLKAAGAEGNQYTLTSNFRSDPALVESVNSFFKRERSFLLEEIEYAPSRGASADMKLQINGTNQPPMTIWEIDKVNADNVAKSTARHIAELLNKAESGNATLNGEKVKPSDIAVLCRSKKQLTKVKRALADCRVPAVVSGSESVFDSDEAKEMVNVLSAVISPFSQTLIKTALTTSIFGFTADHIHGLTETDEWDAITEEFRNYNDLINIKGLAPMFFHMAGRRRLYENIASLPSGERKLTNYIHLTELAQQYEAEKKAAPQDILSWLKDKITTADKRGDEAELKMDSDENAVTIITIHKSKGLEYKIVYTPFLMFKREKPKKTYKYHSGDKYILDMVGSDYTIEQSSKEDRAEDLRIAYVALTRAKAVCYTAWGVADGHSSSAMSYLINGEFAKYDPVAFHSYFSGTNIQIGAMPLPEVQTYKTVQIKPESANKTFTSEIAKPWQINSFSRLIHSSSAGVKDTDQFIKPDGQKQILNEFDIFSFPKGAKAGTCLHECMEEIYFENYTPESIQETVAKKLELFSFDPAYINAVAENLRSIIEKDMYGVRLEDLEEGKYIHEMEFQISTANFLSEEIADIFAKHGEEDFAKAASTLKFKSIQGFMNGFADLIFEQYGRYYVLDWKSNHLGMDKDAYSNEKMHNEMLGSHYYMQLYIYTLALHMHLSNCLSDYDYDAHIGGGLYIFMRGINSDGDEGIYHHRPKKEIIVEMEKLVRRQ